jgi:hypothetical protein
LKSIEDRCRITLGHFDVSTSDYPKHMNFARQLWKIRSSFSGGSLDREIRILNFKYHERGCALKTLDAIRIDVFAVRKPGPKRKRSEPATAGGRRRIRGARPTQLPAPPATRPGPSGSEA